MTVLLSVDAASAGYAGRAILPPVSVDICSDQIWALVGRNGAGKSTLLQTVLGLLPAITGRIDRPSSTTISYVPQRGEYDLSVPARVIDLVRAGADSGWSFLQPGFVRRARTLVQAALDATQVAHLSTRPFAELSEGQKQRVLVARAMVTEPDLIVLDEPTSAMDPVAERAVFSLLEALRAEHRVSMIVASHRMSFLPDFATHAIFVDADQGAALAGTPAEILRSAAFAQSYGVPGGA